MSAFWVTVGILALLAIGELVARWLDVPKYFRPERPDGE